MKNNVYKRFFESQHFSVVISDVMKDKLEDYLTSNSDAQHLEIDDLMDVLNTAQEHPKGWELMIPHEGMKEFVDMMEIFRDTYGDWEDDTQIEKEAARLYRELLKRYNV